MSTTPTKAGAHTPGPWSVGGPTGKLNQIAINPYIGCAYGAGDEVAANAALIAAAPLMLEALKTLHDKTAELIVHLQSTDRLRPCFNLPAIETARSAIAAATGAQGDAS